MMIEKKMLQTTIRQQLQRLIVIAQDLENKKNHAIATVYREKAVATHYTQPIYV